MHGRKSRNSMAGFVFFGMSEKSNRVCKLFGIDYPIVQAGMVWCSGWRLASAVSNAGGLGLIGAGSMYPEVLRDHIKKCGAATTRPFGVNVPLLYPDIDKVMRIIEEEGVRIVFTSAGNPELQHWRYDTFYFTFAFSDPDLRPHKTFYQCVWRRSDH